MKIKRITAILCAAALLLCSCGKAEPVTASTPQSGEAAPQPSSAQETKEITVALRQFRQNEQNPNGFYTVECPQTTQYQNLMFYDYNTMQQRYVCTDPACTHDHAGCTSYIDSWGGVFPYVIGNQLYLNYILYNDGTADRNNWPSAIEQRNLDGTDAKVLVTAESCALSWDFVLTDRESLYTQKSDKMMQVNLTTGEEKDIPWPNMITLPVVYNGCVLGIVRKSEQNEAGAETDLYAISLEDGSMNVLHTFPKGVYGFIQDALHDGEFYYINLTTREIMAYDLATGAETLVTDAFAKYGAPRSYDTTGLAPEDAAQRNNTMQYPASNWQITFIDDWILCTLYADYEEEHVRIFYNTVTGETKETTPLGDFWNGSVHPMTIWSSTPHGILVTEEHRQRTIDAVGTDGAPYSQKSEYMVYALMDFEDLIGGQPNFREITPVAYTGAN